MAEPAKPTEPGGPPPEPKPWYRRFSLALSAFIMSVTITLINAFYSVRGSEIVLLEPEQVILYRDGEGDQAVLAFAMQLPMINAAGGQHGDVMLKADLQPGSDSPRFRYQAVVTPVFTNIPNAADRCDLGIGKVVFLGVNTGGPVSRSCTLPADGRLSFENWPQKAEAVRLSNFRPAKREGSCP